MNLTVNGEEHSHEGDGSLESLLGEMQAVRGRVAVMINGNVVKRKDMPTTSLADGDNVEVMIFAGGG